MNDDRRRSVRARARLMTIVKNIRTGKAHRVLTNNLSGVGISFASEEHLEPGDKLELEIALPDSATPITCRADVVWVRAVGGPRKSYETPTCEIGVKFVDLAPKAQALFKQYAVMNAPPPEP